MEELVQTMEEVVRMLEGVAPPLEEEGKAVEDLEDALVIDEPRVFLPLLVEERCACGDRMVRHVRRQGDQLKAGRGLGRRRVVS